MAHTFTVDAPAQFFAPITRFDAATREVEGFCYVSPTVRGDKWNLKRAAMERAGRKYMEMPCIREMHSKSAAGKGLSLEWTDKGCVIRAKIVDDAAWRKIEEGVYRGFSIGGVPLITRGNDVEEFDWHETSLVDRPADPHALFSVARVDGVDDAAPVEVIALDEGETVNEDGEVVAEAIDAPIVSEPFDEGTPLEIIELEELPEDDENLSDLSETSVEAEASRALEDAEIERAEIERAEIERAEVERYHADQPRDENGKWTIIGGHRVSISGKAVSHDDIHAAAAQFNLSDSARDALVKAHVDGHIETDDHLLRTIAHATNAAGAQDQIGQTHLATGHHVRDAIPVHGKDGSFEKRWAGVQELPQLSEGKKWGSPIGPHQLSPGYVLHIPANEHHGGHGGTVSKVSQHHVELEYDHSGIKGGYRVKKSELKGTGHVLSKNSASVHAFVHHFDDEKPKNDKYGMPVLKKIKHAEMPEITRFAASMMHELQEGDPSHWSVENRHEAVDQIARMLHEAIGLDDEIARDESEERVLDNGEIERKFNPRQPRDDLGKWSNGAGGISAGHAVSVMKHEGIHDEKHHVAVKEAIESGKHKTREDVLKHIDEIHSGQLTKAPALSFNASEDAKRAVDFLATKASQFKSAAAFWDYFKSDTGKNGSFYTDLFAENKSNPNFDDHKSKTHFILNVLPEAIGLEANARIKTKNKKNLDYEAFWNAFSSSERVLEVAEIERGLDSDDVPSRENLEGGKTDKARVSAFKQHLMDGAKSVSADDNEPENEGEENELIRKAIAAALAVLDGEVLEHAIKDPETTTRVEDSNEIQRSEFERLEGDLETERVARVEAETLATERIERIASLEAEGVRLQEEVTRLQGIEAQLRQTPLKRDAPIQFTGLALDTKALERGFAVNRTLQTAELQREQALEALQKQHAELDAQAEKEPDQDKRALLVTRMMSVDLQINQLQRM